MFTFIPRMSWRPFAILCLGTAGLAAAEDRGKIVIQGPERAVRGFPVLWRIMATGPLTVPRISSYRTSADIRLRISAVKGEKTYDITSNESRRYTVSSMSGERIGDGRHFVNKQIKDKEEMAILLELSSLLPYGKGPSFHAVPPGQYTVTVTFTQAKADSEPKPLELVAPSPVDQAFLDEVVWRANLPRRAEFVVWSRVLDEHKSWNLPIAKAKELSDVAQEQMRFHLLVYQIEAGKITSRDQLAAHAVPKYLEAEKEWILLKLDAANGAPGAKETMQTFVSKHPGFAWRFESFSQQLDREKRGSGLRGHVAD